MDEQTPSDLMELSGCDFCGGDHDSDQCPELGLGEDVVQLEPQLSRARLSLPPNLSAFDDDSGSVHVVANEEIPSKTKFGPLEAPRTTSEFIVENGFVLKVFSKDGSSICLDTTDENVCNWMCLVQPAVTVQEQNLMAFQNSTDVFFVATRPIGESEVLRVWYAPHYAKKLNKSPSPDGVTTGLLGRQVMPAVSVEDSMTEDVTVVEDNTENSSPSKVMKFHGRTGHPVLPGLGSYICQRCAATFDTSADLAKHVRETHVREFTYTGRRPGRPRKIPGEESAKPKVMTVNSNYQCAICESVCRSAAALRRHVKLHNKQGKSKCPQCSSEFTDIHILEDHMKTVHKSAVITKKVEVLKKMKKKRRLAAEDEPTQQGAGDNNETAVVPGPLDGAGDGDDTVTDINSVLKSLKKEENKVDEDEESDSDVEEREQSDEEYKPEPYYLQKIEPRKPGTRGRPRKIRIEGSFGCFQCGKVYATQESLANHRCSASRTEGEEVSMDGQDVYDCEICSKKFTKQEYLDRHTARHKRVETESSESSTAEGSENQSEAVSEVETDINDPEYKCDLCYVIFNKEKYLYRHMAIHTGEFTCKNCHASFSRKASLQSHLIKCNPSQLGDDSNFPVFACEKCFRVFGTQLSLENHMIKHSGKYKCDKCERSYSVKENFDNHQCIIEDPNAQYECSQCGSVFKKQKYLIRHEKLHTASFLCTLCSTTFTRKDDLTRHSVECLGQQLLERDGKIQCQYCSEEFVQPEVYRNHVESHTHPFQCQKCNKRFIRKTNMENHQERCDNIPMQGLQCTECGKQFRDSRYLERHLITHQSPLHQCEHCNKKFFRRDYLNAHTCKRKDGVVRTRKRREHIDTEEAHVCYICGKSYITKSNLNKHILVHSEKTFACDVCGKLFHHQHARNLHRSTVHTDELKCQCLQCGKMLKTQATLYAHIKQFHSENNMLFSCQTCGKQFRQKGNMIKHEMMHNGKRSFVCNFCPKTFKYPEQLRRHELGHTRGKTFACNHCDRKFVMAFELKKHLKEFHSGVVYMCQFCSEVCRWRHTMRRHIKRKHEQFAGLLDDPNYLRSLMKSVDDIAQGGRKVVRRPPSPPKDITIQLPAAMASSVGLQIQGIQGDNDIQTVQSFLADNVVSQEAAEALQSLSAGLAPGQNFTIIQNGQEIMVNVTGPDGGDVVEHTDAITHELAGHEDGTHMIMDADDPDAMAAISNVVTSGGTVVTDTTDGQINFSDMSQIAGVTSIQQEDGKGQFLLVTWNPPEGQDAQ